MTALHTADLKAGHNPGTGFGLTWEVTKDNQGTLTGQSIGTFGHGGAFGTQSWADPTTGLIHVFMIQRDKLTPNPDDSLMRRAYQDAVAAALKP